MLSPEISLNNSLDSFFSQKCKYEDMSTPSNAKLDSSIFVLSIEEVSLVHQARDEATSIKEYQVIRWRLIIEDNDNDDSAPYVKSSGESRESLGKASLDRPEASSTSGDDGGPTNEDPRLIEVNKGTITVEKMSELVSKYEVPSSYIYKIPIANEYVSTSGPLEITVHMRRAYRPVFGSLFIHSLRDFSVVIS